MKIFQNLYICVAEQKECRIWSPSWLSPSFFTFYLSIFFAILLNFPVFKMNMVPLFQTSSQSCGENQMRYIKKLANYEFALTVEDRIAHIVSTAPPTQRTWKSVDCNSNFTASFHVLLSFCLTMCGGTYFSFLPSPPQKNRLQPFKCVMLPWFTHSLRRLQRSSCLQHPQ